MRVGGLVLVLVCLTCPRVLAGENWWHEEWPCRVPVLAGSGLYERKDCLIRMPLNLTRLAKDAGMGKGIDVASLRVVEVTEEDGVLRETPSAFRKAKGYKDGLKEEGILLWQMSGKTLPISQRSYHIYFDARGSGKAPPDYAAIPGADEALGKNLLVNAGFEQADEEQRPVHWELMNDWSTYNDSKITGTAKVTRKEARSGKCSLHVDKPFREGRSEGYRLGHRKTPIRIKPKRKYRLSGWIKATGTGEQGVWMYFMNEKWERTGLAADAWAYRTHDWQHVTTVGVAPADARYACVQVGLWLAKGDAYYDDIELIQLPNQEPPKVKVGKPEKAP